jgi:hypothetical protein
MDHNDAERDDVVVILQETPGISFDDAVNQLRLHGLDVSDSDPANGEVEGTIDADKTKSLKSLPFVNYVRKVFEYTADFPPGDPRNMDPAEDSELPDVDDAGA